MTTPQTYADALLVILELQATIERLRREKQDDNRRAFAAVVKLMEKGASQ